MRTLLAFAAVAALCAVLVVIDAPGWIIVVALGLFVPVVFRALVDRR